MWFSLEKHMCTVLIEHLEPSVQLACQDGLGPQLDGSLSVFGIDPSPC